MTSKEKRDAVRRMLSKDWLSARQVAQRLGADVETARAIMRELGAVRRPSTNLDTGPQVEWHLPQGEAQ